MAIKAITAGILYDLGSGSNVDVMIIRKSGYELRRQVKQVGKKETQVEFPFRPLKNNIEVLKTYKITFDKKEEK